MARDFVKLSEVTVLEKVSDTASVLVEQNGEIYRAPKTQVGGAGGHCAGARRVADDALQQDEGGRLHRAPRDHRRRGDVLQL